MDEDDSQDELINRSASQSKGKRPALWDISDDSEDDEAESDEGESDSGEEEGEDNLDEDGEEEEEEEEDEEEEEEDAQAEDGALGGTSADVAGLSSSDEDADKCPICLNSFTSQPVVTPESCEHYFCLDCILEWAKNANSCPVDRITFNNIYLRKCYGGKVKKVITVQKPVKEVVEEIVDLDLEQTSCEVCGGSDREDRLLLCDGCDAGYHMECLTPPLDSVPVEEWFCPECEVSNVQHSRVSAEEVSDTESLPSSARPATSRSQSRVPGPTRAIARTQHSERVRANVNRHRITQARTSQLAPTYMMQSTWLDETINAVVAGLNTAVYVRNFTPRVPSTRRRKTRRRRKKTTSAKGKNGKVASTGVKRRKRRRTKSRRRLVLKKPITPRSRIANNLGIVKDKKSSSLPTVYRPAENTLSNMRADIGAASLSIYGDPFNLDPFVEHEEAQQQDRVTSLLEAKRRGISRSALRSHQPVARPVTASLSRRGMDVPQSGGVMEAAPVPDLLGSILSGQNMLLMDSSDVVINRDGTLKATKQMLPSALTPSCSNSSGDASADINPMMSPNQVDSCMSPPYSSDLPGSSRGSTNRPFSQSSSRLPSSSSSYLPSSQIQPSPHSDLAPRGPHSLQPPRPIRPPQPPGHRATNGFPTSSIHPTHPQSQPKKAAPAKPMWVDVSVLPRIPKIKRESGGIANDCTSPGGSIGSNRSRSNRGNSSDSTTSSNGYEMPESGMNSLAGDKGRQQSVDQQKGRTDGQRQRQSDGGAGSSTSTTAFSNSFSSSSSSTGSPASHPRYPSSSSSSSAAVSFRINASGNSWQSRRLSVGSSSATGESVQERWRKKEEEVKKRQLRRDKQMLLASHTAVDKEQESSTTIYDPFDPTNSESSSSDDEAKNTNPGASSLHATHERKAPSLENRQSKHDLIHVKTERQEIEVSQEQPTRASAQETPSQEARGSQEYVKVKKEKTEKQTALLDTKVKKEPESDEADEAERFAHRLNSDTAHNTTPFYLNPDFIKMERDTTEEESGPRTSNSVSATSKNDSSSASNSASDKKKQKAVTKPDSKSCSKSPSRDGSHKKKTSQAPSRERRSTTPDKERGRRGERHASGQAGRQKDKQKEKERERSGRRSRSKERRKTRTASESSVSDSPDRTHRKRRPSHSPSKDRRRSRSGSSSGSREHSRKKKQKRSSKERNDGRERDTVRRPVSRDKRRGRSRTKSVSKSRSRSRSKDHKRGRSHSRSLERRKKEATHTRAQPSSLCPRDKMESRPKDKRIRRSRSSSRERRKGEVSSSSKSSEKTSKPSVSSRKDTKPLPDKKKDKGQTRSSVKEQKVASGTKAETKAEAHSCTVASKVKREKDLGTDSQATTTEMVEEIKVEKEIKKEKRPSLDMFDMFEDSPITEPIKKEEADTQSLADVKGKDELGTKEVTVQTETCVVIKTEPIDDIETEPSDITIMNSEQSSPKLCEEPPVTSCSTQTIPVKAESIQDDVSQSHPVSMASVEQPNTVVSTVHIKQELQQPSDSDDDFNVDVMLDNLDYVKSEPEPTEGTGASVKQEKEPEEEKTEGQILPIVGGAKSKTQVKRVTWNIQEPEGPQPEKSASKLALYKLKLKQEGARRPSSTVQTSSQDVTGAVSAVGPISSSSRSDGEGLSTSGEGETEERTNQQYLKKLHMQERAVEEVKLAIKPFYQNRDIDKDEYKEILRKAVQKVCHSKSGEINPVKVGNLVKAYVDKYRHARKYKKGEDSEGQTESMNISDSP